MIYQSETPITAFPPTRPKIRFCTAPDGVKIAYGIAGNGPPLVKTGNWLSHLETDPESPLWRHWVSELSRLYRYVRYDSRGSGLSQREVGDIEPESWLGDLEAVVEAAGLERFALLGISGGAGMAIAYAARHPEKVSHLVLFGGTARGAMRRDLTPPQRQTYDYTEKLVALGWDKETPAFRTLYAMQMIRTATPEQYRIIADLERAVNPSADNAAAVLRMFNDLDVTAEAARVTCPTLVLHCTGDEGFPLACGREMASLIPGARFVPLSSRNHILLENEPAWRSFLDEVRAFLPKPETGAFATLTPRERAMLDLVARGLSNGQIAALVGLSEKTVKNRITSIFAKLKVRSRPQAIVLAREAGFGLGPAPAG